jgi:hypothetical protein
MDGKKAKLIKQFQSELEDGGLDKNQLSYLVELLERGNEQHKRAVTPLLAQAASHNPVSLTPAIQPLAAYFEETGGNKPASLALKTIAKEAQEKVAPVCASLETGLDASRSSIRSNTLETFQYVALSRPEAVAPMANRVIDCLDDPDAAVSLRAAMLLSQLADTHPDAVEAGVDELAFLARKTDDRRAEEAIAALADLAAAKPSAVAPVVESIASLDAGVDPAKALRYVAREQPDAVKPVTDWLVDNIDGEMPTHVPIALGNVAFEDPTAVKSAVGPLLKTFPEQGPLVRLDSLWAIAEIEVSLPDCVRPQLAAEQFKETEKRTTNEHDYWRVLNHITFRKRGTDVSGLVENYRDEHAANLLEHLEKESRSHYRRIASRFLRHDAAYVPALIAPAADEIATHLDDASVRENLLEALVLVTEHNPDRFTRTAAIEGVLSESNPTVRERGCQILQHTGDGSTIATLKPLTDDSNYEVRAAALSALKQISAREGLSLSEDTRQKAERINIEYHGSGDVVTGSKSSQETRVDDSVINRSDISSGSNTDDSSSSPPRTNGGR